MRKLSDKFCKKFVEGGVGFCWSPSSKFHTTPRTLHSYSFENLWERVQKIHNFIPRKDAKMVIINLYFTSTGWPVKHGRVFSCLGKSDLYSVHVYIGIHFTQGSRKIRPCLTGHSVPYYRIHKKNVKNNLLGKVDKYPINCPGRLLGDGGDSPGRGESYPRH